MRKKVYIAGPITKGPLKANVDRATAAFVRLAKAGYAPFCPHWSVYSSPCAAIDPALPHHVIGFGTPAGNAEMTHADWLGVDLPWVAVADAVLRLPGESVGADLEVRAADDHRVPVFHSVEDVAAYFNHRG